MKRIFLIFSVLLICLALAAPSFAQRDGRGGPKARVFTSTSLPSNEQNTDPTATDDASKGYKVGDFRVNELTNTSWQCIDNTIGIAMWLPVGSGTSSFTVTGTFAVVHSGVSLIQIGGGSGDLARINGTLSVHPSATGASVFQVDPSSGLSAYGVATFIMPGTSAGVIGSAIYDSSGATVIAHMQNKQTILPQVNLASNPTLAFGYAGTGIYGYDTSTLRIANNGLSTWGISSGYLYGLIGTGGLYNGAAASATVASVLPNINDLGTGLGWIGADQLSLISGGVEGYRIIENTNVMHQFNMNGTAAGVSGFGIYQSMTGATAVAVMQNKDALFYGNVNALSGVTIASKLDVGAASSTAMVNITPGSAIAGMFIDQNNDNYALNIDCEAPANAALFVTGKYVATFTQDIAGGRGVSVSRNIAEAGSNPLVQYLNSNASNTQPTLFIDHNGTGGAAGYAIHVDSENAAGPAVRIESANTIGLYSDKSIDIASGTTYFLDSGNGYGIWIGSDGKAYVKDATSSRQL